MNNLLRNVMISCLIFTVLAILSVCVYAGTNKPAIDLANVGVARWFNSETSNAIISIKVIDHDGISSDGTSHSFSVRCPDNTVYPITSGYSINSTSYQYEGSAGDIQNGIYTLIVEDEDVNIVEVTDTIDTSYSLAIPDQISFVPSNGSTISDTTPTFSWAAVSGANYYRVRIYKTDGSNDTVWKGYPGNNTSYSMPPGILLPGTTYKYRISARDCHQGLEIDHCSYAPASSDNYINFTTGSQDNAPHIDLDSAGVQTWQNDHSGLYYSFWIKIYDAQGCPGDIKEVTVTTPGAKTFPLYFYYQTSSNCAVYRNHPHDGISLQSGTYTFKVVDKSGNTVTKTEELTANPIGYPSRASITGTLTGTTGTSLEVDWADVPGAAFYRLEIYNSSFSRIYTFATTVSEYTVPEGFLQAGELYRYSIKTRREFFDQNVDNGSNSYGWDKEWPTLVPSPVIGTNQPVIDLDKWGVATSHRPNQFNNGATSIYKLIFWVKVTDNDGLPGNDARVIVTYPGTLITTATLQPYSYIDATSAYYFGVVPYTNSASIPNGTYTFQVIDNESNTASVTDDLVVDIIDMPANLKPVKNSSVIGAAPKIEWDNITDALKYRVQLYSGFSRIHRGYTTDNFYRVPANTLENNSIYNYRVEAFRENFPDVEVDNMSTTFSSTGNRFYFMTIGSSAMPWIPLLLLD